MNKKAFFIILFVILANPYRIWAVEPQISAKAAVLLDYETGQVLWGKNSQQSLPPASTTKILTAILAYDMGKVTKECLISPKASSIGEASLNLRSGEVITLEDLLKGALMRSGNDACVAIAENVAGSEGLFVKWMNLKAELLGGNNSHFINTNGLPAPEHTTTVYDLAMICRYAMHNTQFSSVVSTRFDVIGSGGSKRYLKNTNKLLWKYPWAIGVKTGTTNEAGKCLVAAAEKEGKRYIAVVLNSMDRYGESQRILEYGINNFSDVTIFNAGEIIKKIPVINGMEKEIGGIILSKEITTIPNHLVNKIKINTHIVEKVSAPIKKGQSLGHIDVTNEKGKIISKINVVADKSVPQKKFSLFKYFSSVIVGHKYF